jgi:carbon storage regulator CsrA
MLVLSRRLKEKIVFPTIQTEVQVLEMHGGQVRLGIEAPPQVSVIRDELRDPAKSWDDGDMEFDRRPAGAGRMREFRHEIRNRLNDIGLTLALLRSQMQKGESQVMEATLQKVEEDFRNLKAELEVGFSEAGPERFEEAAPPVGVHSE